MYHGSVAKHPRGMRQLLSRATGTAVMGSRQLIDKLSAPTSTPCHTTRHREPSVHLASRIACPFQLAKTHQCGFCRKSEPLRCASRIRWVLHPSVDGHRRARNSSPAARWPWHTGQCNELTVFEQQQQQQQH